MNAGESSAVLGSSVKILGNLSGSEDLVMDGELQGTIHLPGGRLTLGHTARVRADIVAKDVILFGRLEGDIRATGRVELRASALMQGNIYAGSLSIEENAAFRGKVDPSRSQEPLPSAPIAIVDPPPAVPAPTVLRPLSAEARPLPAALAAAVAAAAAARTETGSLAAEGERAERTAHEEHEPETHVIESQG